jgi:hypothetical protein
MLLVTAISPLRITITRAMCHISWEAGRNTRLGSENRRVGLDFHNRQCGAASVPSSSGVGKNGAGPDSPHPDRSTRDGIEARPMRECAALQLLREENGSRPLYSGHDPGTFHSNKPETGCRRPLAGLSCGADLKTGYCKQRWLQRRQANHRVRQTPLSPGH